MALQIHLILFDYWLGKRYTAFVRVCQKRGSICTYRDIFFMIYFPE